MAGKGAASKRLRETKGALASNINPLDFEEAGATGSVRPLRHLAGRLFSVVVHGDVEGAENVRRSISDWLCFMHLCSAGATAELDRYIGYWKPYATSHEDLDADTALQRRCATPPARCSKASAPTSTASF